MNNIESNTESYRMLCALFNLKKRDGNKLVDMFAAGGYDISKSRAMNLLSKQKDMRTEELNAFICGIFHFNKNNE